MPRTYIKKSRKQKIKTKTNSKTKSNRKTKSNSKTKLNSKTKSNSKINLKQIYNSKFTARIIIKDNTGGIVVDKDTIKEILDSIGGKVDVVIYNNIKNNINIKNESKSKLKFNKVDIQIFIEHINLEYPLDIFPADKSYLLINQEYLQEWDIDRMKDKTIIPLCKTYCGLNTLHKLNIMTAKYIGFGNNKKFTYIDDIEKIPNLFIHIEGSSPLKGTKTLIDTWIYKKIKEILIITGNNKAGGNTNLFKYWKSLNPYVKPLPETVLKKWVEWKKITKSNAILPQFQTINSCPVFFCNIEVDYNIIVFLQSIADVHMCPSLIEGWGQYIDEGRRSKSVVVTLDAAPMNELINDSTTGILVKASNGPNMRQLLPYGWTQYFTKNNEYNKFLYETFKTNVNELYIGVNRILKMTLEEKRKLGNNAFKQSQKDYDTFKTNFTKLILDA